MLEYDWEDSIGYWITATAHAMRLQMSQELSRVQGITFRHYEVLACLSVRETATQAEIAECLGITAPTLTGIIDRMVNSGYLTRECCNEDRRRNIICPTEKAEMIWEQLSAIAHSVREKASRGISAADLSTLREVCRKLQDNLHPPRDDSSSSTADGKINNSLQR